MLFDGSTYLSSNDSIDTISECYDLDDTVDDRLELSYVTYIRNAGKTKEENLVNVVNMFNVSFRKDSSKDLPYISLTIHDINVKV